MNKNREHLLEFYHPSKSFSKDEQQFKDYYASSFFKDLVNWFKISRRHDGVNVISNVGGLFMYRPFKCSEVDEYGFSVACFYTFLIPQIVAISTECFEAFYLFSRASGWPVCRNDVYGYESPALILAEAKLEPSPDEDERIRCISMLKAEKAFFIRNLKKFLAGTETNQNEDAYARLCKLAQGKIENIEQGISEQVEAYVSYLKWEAELQRYLMPPDFRHYRGNHFFFCERKNELPRNCEDEFVVENKEHLKAVIEYCIKNYGNECDLNFLDVSKVYDLSFLFKESQFNGNIENWDVSHVVNMTGMFLSSQFNGDIGNWDVSNVHNWHNVLKNCPCKKYPSKFDEECNWENYLKFFESRG